MIAELTHNDIDLVAGGVTYTGTNIPGVLPSQPLTIGSSLGGFTNTGDPAAARRFVLARDRFLRSTPSVTAMDFGLGNLP